MTIADHCVAATDGVQEPADRELPAFGDPANVIFRPYLRTNPAVFQALIWSKYSAFYKVVEDRANEGMN